MDIDSPQYGQLMLVSVISGIFGIVCLRGCRGHGPLLQGGGSAGIFWYSAVKSVGWCHQNGKKVADWRDQFPVAIVFQGNRLRSEPRLWSGAALEKR